jgi:hypothetical protein|tara:strand:- start:70 stop:1047 length:978 start_codon:yes stop_codon:yes gene_type:complete
LNNNDSRRIWGSVGILLAIILSIGSIFPFTIYAQESKGSFIEYSFNYSIEKSEEKEKSTSEIEDKPKQKKSVEKKELDKKSTMIKKKKSGVNREGSGNLRIEVLKNFGNGTLRIEKSGSLNNAEFQVKNNVAEDRFILPYLSTLPQFDQTITGENGTISIRTERLADETVTIQGTSWVLNVTRITIEAEGTRNDKEIVNNVEGELKIFAISGLIHSFVGGFQQEISGTTVKMSIMLVDTNLDIENKPESRMNLFSQIDSLASFGLGTTPMNGLETSSQSSFATSSYLLIGSLVGVISLISFIVLMSKRRIRKNSSTDEKPIHWVH